MRRCGDAAVRTRAGLSASLAAAGMLGIAGGLVPVLTDVTPSVVPLAVAVSSLTAVAVAALASLILPRPSGWDRHTASTGTLGETVLGRTIHRIFVTLIALLSRGLRVRAWRAVFDAQFSLSDDPWSYRDAPYEARKRDALVAPDPDSTQTIVEMGCADGHNVKAIACCPPDALVFGFDVSGKAVAKPASRPVTFPTSASCTWTRTGAAPISRNSLRGSMSSSSLTSCTTLAVLRRFRTRCARFVLS